MIYHVVNTKSWQAALKLGYYEAGSLATEGFIHASKEDQVKGVLERYYQGQPDLLLLHIDESKLTSELKYEISPSINEAFPHIFGNINLDDPLVAAVQCTTEASPTGTGTITYGPGGAPYYASSAGQALISASGAKPTYIYDATGA